MTLFSNFLLFKQQPIFQFLKFGFHERMKKQWTIAVEGNIGSGKTTFISQFKDNENVFTVSEPIQEWKNVHGYNLLQLMYSDASKWAFTFQTYVQLTMTKLHEIKTERPVKIMERSLYSARYCFVENLYNAGVLPKAQLVVLDEWFNWLIIRKEMACDLIVYLRTSPEVAYKRIKLRNREEEKNLSLEVIKRLHNCHEDWLHLKKFYCPFPVLTIDADKDLEAIKDECKHFQNKINGSLQGFFQ